MNWHNQRQRKPLTRRRRWMWVIAALLSNLHYVFNISFGLSTPTFYICYSLSLINWHIVEEGGCELLLLPCCSVLYTISHHFNPSLSWKPQPKKVTKEVKNELKREDVSSFSCCVGCPLLCCVLNPIYHYLLMFICPLPYLEGEGQDSCEWFLSLRVVLCIQYLIAHYRCLSAVSLINVLSKNSLLMMWRTRGGRHLKLNTLIIRFAHVVFYLQSSLSFVFLHLITPSPLFLCLGSSHTWQIRLYLDILSLQELFNLCKMWQDSSKTTSMPTNTGK